MYVTEIKQHFVDDVYKGVRQLSKPFNNFFSNVEVEKINKIFEELIKDFKLYTKRCVAFNCKYNNEFDLKLKKKLKQNKTKIIKIDDKPKQVNLTTEIDEKPIESNLLDKNNDCLTIPICINIKDEEVEISKTLDKIVLLKLLVNIIKI